MILRNNVGDENATQVSLKTFQKEVDVVSLHIPWTPLTNSMVNSYFINQFSKTFWLLNTARGKSRSHIRFYFGFKNRKNIRSWLGCFRV